MSWLCFDAAFVSKGETKKCHETKRSLLKEKKRKCPFHITKYNMLKWTLLHQKILGIACSFQRNFAARFQTSILRVNFMTLYKKKDLSAISSLQGSHFLCGRVSLGSLLSYKNSFKCNSRTCIITNTTDNR